MTSVKKKNICVFIETLLSGGAEKQAVLLSKALKPDHNVFLVVWKGYSTEPKFIQLIESNEITAVYLKGTTLLRLGKLIFFLKSNKINIIFSFLASNNLYGAIAGKLTGVKYIIGGIRNAEIPYFKFVVQRILHNYILNYTIFNNYTGKDNLINKGFSPDKSYVIPNCFELTTAEIVRGTKTTITIITLARFVAQKDYLTALKAVKILTGRECFEHDIKYLIIGYGVLEQEIRTHIKDMDLENTVSIIINPNNITEYLTGADIYLSTSLFEGTSNSILEAMSYCLPIVATDAGDNKYLIEDDETGFICEVGNHAKIAGKLRILIESEEKRRNYGLKAYNRLKENYSMDMFIKRYNEFINKL